MNAATVSARSAIEALRAGVPSRHAVAQLGTTQRDLKEQFEDSLEALRLGHAVKPLVISANFGAGKSHLLNYLQTLAAGQHIATSFVIVSPEMPLGNAHLVMKAVTESAVAPGRTGKALRSLAAELRTDSDGWTNLRAWATDAPIHDKFKALLAIYEEFRVDPELQTQVLNDFEGRPMLMNVIKARLKEIGQLSGYDLKSPRNTALGHDRLLLFAQFMRACGCHGIVVLFDELERMAKFSAKQRIAAYEELGWWRNMAETAGSAILPVFTMTNTFLNTTVTGGTHDELRFQPTMPPFDERDADALAGIELLKKRVLLAPPTPEEEEEVKYRVKAIYEQAYERNVPNLPASRDVSTSIRSQIRRWITYWDLQRYDPKYRPDVEEGAVHFDESAIADDVLLSGDETDD